MKPGRRSGRTHRSSAAAAERRAAEPRQAPRARQQPHGVAPPGAASRRISAPGTIDLSQLSVTELQVMAAAGREIRECYRVLAKTGDNIVGEALRDQGTFYEWTHYPLNDVFDHLTHSQFYYHVHPTGQRFAEHGHFHTFLRPRGMPRGVRPAAVPPPNDPAEPAADEGPAPADSAALSHLVAISMDPAGVPIRLFTTNRWVTGETWYSAADVCAMLDRFVIDHTRPSWALNRWISAMFRLFKPQIIELLHARDRTIADRPAPQDAALSVYDDRSLEVTSVVEIDVDRQIRQVEAALARIA